MALIVDFVNIGVNELYCRRREPIFDSAVAFNRYRLEVMRSWPASKAKDKLMAAIECCSQKSERSGPAGTPEGREVVTGSTTEWQTRGYLLQGFE